MNKNIFIITLFLLVSCSEKKSEVISQASSVQQQEEHSCICTKEFDPVCGADGIEYGNPCEAECAGVKWTPGGCAGKEDGNANNGEDGSNP